MKKLNLAVLISGEGSNLQAIIDACTQNDFPAEISIVISNRPDAYGLQRAQNAKIPSVTIDHTTFETRTAFDAAVQAELEKHPIDLICLAGFMRILSAEFIEKWPNKIINTHPSLLPKFGGKGMYGQHVHRAVLESGDTQSGATIHYVTPEVDQGATILQSSTDVLPNDTIESLSDRVIKQEHIAYPEAIRMIAEKTA